MSELPTKKNRNNCGLEIIEWDAVVKYLLCRHRCN